MQNLFINHSLANYTSWKVGGPADKFFQVDSLNNLAVFLKTLPKATKLIWLGLGSNVLIRDKGIRGTVIYTAKGLKNIELKSGLLRVEAGVSCARLAQVCKEHDFCDGAFFAGIPGTVGGAIFMNAGAFGCQTWDHIVAVELINNFGEITKKTPKDFAINYRHVEKKPNEWFVATWFEFVPNKLNRIKDSLKERKDKQPLGQLSCGSVFKNPPHDFAGRLIEAAGLKGRRIGGAFVSEKHANFIINDGSASAHDIEELILLVQREVLAKAKVELELEVHILGEADGSGRS